MLMKGIYTADLGTLLDPFGWLFMMAPMRVVFAFEIRGPPLQGTGISYRQNPVHICTRDNQSAEDIKDGLSLG